MKPYDYKEKIETARLLKELRRSKRNKKGKPYSHKSLEENINKKYGVYCISDKTLMNYEIVDTSHDNFEIGLGMKLENLVLLADFYGVSCDFIVGREKTNAIAKEEYRFEIGLDLSSVQVLAHLCKQNDSDSKQFLKVINFLIQSYENSDCEQKLMISENTADEAFFEHSFINKLKDYIFFSCDPQYIQTRNDLAKKDYMGTIVLQEDDISNLLLK